MIDSGSQSDVIGPRVAQALGIRPQGSFELSGAASVHSLGAVLLQGLKIGDWAFPASMAAVLDMDGLARHPIDGVLGFPFLSSAEVRLDVYHQTLTIGSPGSLPAEGDRISVDTRNSWPEVDGIVDRVQAHVLIDTGDTNELLLFKDFIDTHPGLVQLVPMDFAQNHAVGGSMHALRTIVDELDLGRQKLFKRKTDVIFATKGTFADPNIAANVGLGSLKQFVVTFDLADNAMYLEQAPDFDSGRFRSIKDLTNALIPQCPDDIPAAQAQAEGCQ